MKVYAYIRVSTDLQVESGVGIKYQKDVCTQWAAERSMEIERCFVEDAISGASGLEMRPKLMLAIAMLSKGDVLVVARRDRLGRDVLVMSIIESEIERKGARIASVAGEGTENNDPTSLLMRRMVDAFAEFDRKIICGRVKAAMQAKKDRNERCGHIRFGYKLADDGVHLEVNEDDIPALHRILNLGESGFTIPQIVDHLNENGLFNRGGMKWKKSTVHRYLQRLRETGVPKYAKSEMQVAL